MAPRLLFQCPGRRGLGHLMRGMNIAREVRRQCPEADIRFLTAGPAAEAVLRGEFGHAGVDGNDPVTWREALREFAPHAVIYDTLLPPELPPGPRSVYVMRKCKEERQQAIFGDPLLRRMDLMLIPHTRDEFGASIPRELRPRSCHVGPIVRRVWPAVQEDLSLLYGLRTGVFLVVSTAGGGGFAESAARFFAVVIASHRRLQERLPGLRHIVVAGPNYRGPLPTVEGMTVVAHEPELVNLISLADVVIAEGGYNTVNEIRFTKTPAVFLPGDRNYDDQEERVRGLEQAGLAHVCTGDDVEGMADEIARFCAAPERLAAIRTRYADDEMPIGNCLAAERILALLD